MTSDMTIPASKTTRHAIRRAATRVVLGIACLGTVPVASCTTAQPTEELAVSATGYDAAFVAVREVLRDYRFDIDRVDARAGVITTAPKSTAGFATPWDGEQQTLGQEWEDLTNRQQRTVRVIFEPASARLGRERGPTPQSAPGPARADIRTLDEPIGIRVQVIVDRINRPHFRGETENLRSSTHAREPALRARGMQPSYAVPRDRDRLFEQKLLGAIERKLATIAPDAVVAVAEDGA